MVSFFARLKKRNALFYYLGIIFLFLFVFFLIAFGICHYEIARICHWIKPFKFSLSFALYCFSLGWLMEYLKEIWEKAKIEQISFWIALLVVFEMGIILVQSRLFFSSMVLYHLANAIILLNTLLFTYVAMQFFRKLTLKPISYLWAIRGSFIVFILSSLIGIYLVQEYGPVSPDSKHFGIPFSEVSSARQNLISLHFVGLHYLQALPLCCYYFDLGKWFPLFAVGLYVGICLFVLI